jgi:dTMP kinase
MERLGDFLFCAILFLMERGIFLAFEGIDGSGKTTQVRMLQQALTAAGEQPVTSKEPTDGPWGQKIRESAKVKRLGAEEELDLFIRDRTDHVNTLVRPSLDDGRIVILDRYLYSTIAYQGSSGADPASIEQRMVSLFPLPHVVYWLDVHEDVGLSRIRNGRGETPNEFETAKGLSAARRIFAELAARPNVHRIDATQSPEQIHRQVIEHFTEEVLVKHRCAKSYGCDNNFECSFRMTNTCEWLTLTQSLRSALA